MQYNMTLFYRAGYGLTLKTSPFKNIHVFDFPADDNCNFDAFSKITRKLIFHENRLLADDSHVISYLIFVENWERCSQNLWSAAVVIGALRVKRPHRDNKLYYVSHLSTVKTRHIILLNSV